MTITMDSPPTYTASNEEYAYTRSEHKTNAYLTVSQRLPNENCTYSIHCTGSSLDIRDGKRNLYHAAFYHRSDRPNIRLYGGYDSKGPQLGLSKFTYDRADDLNIYLGGESSPNEHNWTSATAIRDRKINHTPSYQFDIRTPSYDIDDLSVRRLRWQKCRTGKRRFFSEDFDLIDEANGVVVASYHDRKAYADRNFIGNVSINRRLGVQAETATLLVLFSILDRVNRYMMVMIRSSPASE